jgi:hypothetical protein
MVMDCEMACEKAFEKKNGCGFNFFDFLIFYSF